MIRKLIRSWKEEWLNRHEAELAKEFDAALSELRANTQDILSESRAKQENLKLEIEAKERELNLKQLEVDVIVKQVEERKARLEKEEAELRHKTKLVEAKAAPDQVWLSAFSLGFSKAWDMMIPVMASGNEKLRESIYNQTIDELLKANPQWVKHGNNKKTY